MCETCANTLTIKLSSEDLATLKHSANAAEKAEKKALIEFEKLFEYLAENIAIAIRKRNPIPTIDFEQALLKNAFNAMEAGFESIPVVTEKKTEKINLKKSDLPSIIIPKNPAELRKWWDAVRKKRAPLRIQKQAAAIKKAYLQKVYALTEEFDRSFKKGETWDQELTKGRVKHALKVGVSRAKTIVRTETTRYFNQARVNYYSEDEDLITHFLFVCVRDKATTPWCKTRQGLIYKTGSEILKKETPPIHYNCRSELLPLSPFNPRHKLIISQKSKWRENNRPVPLPPGWNK